MWNSRGDWKKYQRLIVGGIGIVGVVEKIVAVGGGGGSIAFFFPFLTMKTTVLRTFVYTVKAKQKQK